MSSDAASCPSGPAAVECGPGYPMALRLFNPVDDRLGLDPERPGNSPLSLGYPVVDTPEQAGHFCEAGRDGAGFGPEVIGVMCRYTTTYSTYSVRKGSLP